MGANFDFEPDEIRPTEYKMWMLVGLLILCSPILVFIGIGKGIMSIGEWCLSYYDYFVDSIVSRHGRLG